MTTPWLPSKAACVKRSFVRAQEDNHLFRRLLPAMLWKSFGCTWEPGDPAAYRIQIQRLPAEIGFFVPRRLVPFGSSG